MDLDRPFVVFNVRDLEPELRPLGVYLIADYIWRQVRASRRPRMLLIDEAWSLMQHEEGARFLSSMARQARKHYLGLTTVTQDVEDFLATPEGHTVLANSSVQLLMRQDSSTIDVVTQTFRLSAGEREFLLSCRKGEGLFFARGNHIALRVEASPHGARPGHDGPGRAGGAGGGVMVYDIDGIKHRNPIEEVVAGHGVALRRSGTHLMGRCPFHQDEHPSLVVYPETRSFYCFGCGASGDVIDFVRRAEGLSFVEALERLGGHRDGRTSLAGQAAHTLTR